MKSILIHNFTKREVRLVDAFLQKRRLYNIHALVDGDAFTDELAKLGVRYGLNFLVRLDCVENGHHSLIESEKRNPGLEDRLKAFPKHKLEIFRRSGEEPAPSSVVGLAVNFEGCTVRNCRSLKLLDGFYHERDVAIRLLEEMQNEYPGISVKWAEELENDFQFIDFGLLYDLGMIGEEECLVMTK